MRERGHRGSPALCHIGPISALCTYSQLPSKRVSQAGSACLDLSTPNSSIVIVLQPQALGMNPHAGGAACSLKRKSLAKLDILLSKAIFPQSAVSA